jgi:TPR repeat protein
MKKWILFIAAILLLCSSVARADDFDDATDAYEKGNYDQAIELFRLLAEQGNAGAQNNLGVMYRNGEGVTQDYVRARMWFNLAARKGDEDAKENRLRVAKKMTLPQISEAQKMTRDCEKKNYKNCE